MFFIYRLTDGELDYYGQTEDPKQRETDHKKPSSQKCMSKLLDKSKMKLHIIHRLYTQEEADETEEFYQLNFPCVNKTITGRTKQEYYQTNKDLIKKKNVAQYQRDRDKKLKQKAEYYKKNKDKIAAKKAIYREEHKEKIKSQVTEYREKNKEKLAAKRAEPYECECGSVVTHSGKAAHFRSQKHQDYINQK
tara:strand:+ start:157 stop:732 length:576 start_codon:yes stop_codon:yes gene_type:complete